MNYLCVFCGSSKGGPAIYAETARRFGEALAGRGWGLVYGGGHIGLMGVLADAALPGGVGTADEFFEIVTWRQLRLHAKPIGLLNVAGFFDPLLAWLDRTVADGFLCTRSIAVCCTSPKNRNGFSICF